jgi:putative polyhydroxyalkanoate system protein
MAEISITHPHALPLAAAKAAAQKIADKLVSDYDMRSAWEGEVLTFSRSGVSGKLAVTDSVAQLDIALGFMLAAFAPKIESEVSRAMEKAFKA